MERPGSRPYFGHSIYEIISVFEKSQSDHGTLKKLEQELSHRKSRKAKELAKQISRVLGVNGATVVVKPTSSNKPPTSTNLDSKKPPVSVAGATSPSKATFSLTSEQKGCLDLFSTGNALKVSAFAGAGKTTTLVEMARTKPKSGIYLAFNRSIANEAKGKFPKYIDCRTIHSLAYRSVRGQYYNDNTKLFDSLNSNAIAKLLNVDDIQFSTSSFKARSIGALTRSTLRAYLHSESEKLSFDHVPVFGVMTRLPKKERFELRQEALRLTEELWQRMVDPDDKEVPLGHDGYVKVWALEHPVLEFDYIMLDEAQDSNPVVLDVLNRQQSQLVYVGDKHQQIYEWRGAINAMDTADASHHGYLTQSFRFGSTIAEAASKVLSKLGERRAIQGNPRVKSQIRATTPDAILCRTNPALITELVALLQQGQKPAVVGGVNDFLRLLWGVRDLQNGRPSDVPEFFGFTNWSEVVEHSKTDDGQDLRTLVTLVEMNGIGQLISALKDSDRKEEDASVVLSTTHKAKGREWQKVRLVDDFVTPRKSETGEELPLSKEELRIAYVAMTRAKTEVELPEQICRTFRI